MLGGVILREAEESAIAKDAAQPVELILIAADGGVGAASKVSARSIWNLR